MALTDDQKLNIMEEAFRNGYKGYISDLFAQADPQEAAMSAQSNPEAPAMPQEPGVTVSSRPGEPIVKPPPTELPSQPETPGFQSLVQSYESADPGQAPRGETVTSVLDDPSFYRAGGFRTSELLDLDLGSTNPKDYMNNYVKGYKYVLGGIKKEDPKEDLFVEYQNDSPTKPGPITPVEFSDYYYTSDRHANIMKQSGYSDEEIAKRSEFLKDEGPQIKETADPDVKSQAFPNSNTIIMNPQRNIDKGFPNANEVLAHELGHLSTGYKGLNKTDTKELVDRNALIKLGSSFDDKAEEEHYALEMKADLDAIRYLLYSMGIYDAGQEDFDYYDMTQTREALKDSPLFKRLMKNYDDNDFMWLMNNVALGDPTDDQVYEDIQYAREGGFSEKGYKKNSPDKDRAFNIIPGNDITMKGVDFPVLGIDNLGNGKIMKPGKNYKFKGDSVLEFPLGGYRKFKKKK